MQMRVGLGQFNELTDEKLAFIKQMGCDDFLMNTPRLSGDKQWEYDDLAALKKRADDAELRLMALENVPTSFYDKIMLGQNGREEQLQHMLNTVHNMGKAGIPILGYHWVPNSVWRTPEPATLRGGARATRFALAEHDPEELTHGRVFTHEEMWENLLLVFGADPARSRRGQCPFGPTPGRPTHRHYLGRHSADMQFFRRLQTQHGHLRQSASRPRFLHGVLVGDGRPRQRHPRRPPLRRPKENHLHPLPRRHWAGGGLPRDLHRLRSSRYLRSRQDAQGGRLRRLYDSTDHVPHVVDDSPWGHRGRAHCVGFMQALIQVVNKLSA